MGGGGYNNFIGSVVYGVPEFVLDMEDFIRNRLIATVYLPNIIYETKNLLVVYFYIF